MKIRLIHYLAFAPTLHFGMSEDEYVNYTSSYEPRSLVLARLRDEMGWEVAIYVLSCLGSRRCVAAPLNIPMYFHEFTGSVLLPFFEKIDFARRRLLRILGSVEMLAEIRRNPPRLFVFRGNMFSIYSHFIARYLKRKNIPYLFENHGSGIVIDRQCRAFVRGAKKLIVLSQEAAVAFIDGYGISPDSVAVISNGVAIDQFKPTEGDNRLGFPRLAFVGRPSYEKGFDLALEGLRRALKRWPDAMLEVAGKPLPENQGFYEASLRGLTHEERLRVKLLGWANRDELIELYNRSDVMLFPSRIPGEGHGEGEPRAVLEAMSCGLPVVAIDKSGGHCDIILCSEAGALAPIADAFSESLLKYLGDASRIAEDRAKARQYILKNHSIEAVYERYKCCCLEVLEQAAHV